MRQIKQTQTDFINIVIMRLISAFGVLHFLNHVLVKAKAESVLVVDEWLEDEVQALLYLLQLLDIGALFQQVAVR